MRQPWLTSLCVFLASAVVVCALLPSGARAMDFSVDDRGILIWSRTSVEASDPVSFTVWSYVGWDVAAASDVATVKLESAPPEGVVVSVPAGRRSGYYSGLLVDVKGYHIESGSESWQVANSAARDFGARVNDIPFVQMDPNRIQRVRLDSYTAFTADWTQHTNYFLQPEGMADPDLAPFPVISAGAAPSVVVTVSPSEPSSNPVSVVGTVAVSSLPSSAPSSVTVSVESSGSAAALTSEQSEWLMLAGLSGAILAFCAMFGLAFKGVRG